MLRELKNHNPKHDLEYMFENCVLHEFVDRLILNQSVLNILKNLQILLFKGWRNKNEKT